MAEVADNQEGDTVTDAWVMAQHENLDLTVDILCGNSYSWQSISPETFTIPYGRVQADSVTDSGASLVPSDQFHMPALQKGAGPCVSIRVTSVQTFDIDNTMNATQAAEVVFSGWGLVSVDGAMVQRPPGLYNQNGVNT
jgi:hypothetical protein